MAGLLAAAEDAPPLGLVGTDGAGLAVLLHADVEFAFRDAAGVDQTLSGRDAAAWLDRLLDTVPEQWSLARDGAGAADEWSDLQAGVARGNGLATGTPAPAPETAADVPVPPVEPAPEQNACRPRSTWPLRLPRRRPRWPPRRCRPRTSCRCHSLDEEPDGESVRAPLPLAGADEPPPPPEPDEPEVPHVHGVICARGHFNDPTSPFCASCGISMVQQTHNLVEGPRPPLGVLVLDDGSTYVVDRDIVIGREPDTDPAVAAGDVRGIALPDPERAISRVHARVTLQEWDVLHQRCRLGQRHLRGARRTPLSGPRYQPDSPVALTPGMHVLVGPRVLSFDSHRRS